MMRVARHSGSFHEWVRDFVRALASSLFVGFPERTPGETRSLFLVPMLRSGNFAPWRTLVMLALALTLLAVSMTCAGSSSRSCGGWSTSSAAHHASRSHHGGACIRSDVDVVLMGSHHGERHTRRLNTVAPGDMILSEDDQFLPVDRVVCHFGHFSLWKMPSLPCITTANHPVKINGTWHAGDVEQAWEQFHIRTSPLGEPSTVSVHSVCSVETTQKRAVAIVVVADRKRILVAD